METLTRMDRSFVAFAAFLVTLTLIALVAVAVKAGPLADFTGWPSLVGGLLGAVAVGGAAWMTLAYEARREARRRRTAARVLLDELDAWIFEFQDQRNRLELKSGMTAPPTTPVVFQPPFDGRDAVQGAIGLLDADAATAVMRFYNYWRTYDAVRAHAVAVAQQGGSISVAMNTRQIANRSLLVASRSCLGRARLARNTLYRAEVDPDFTDSHAYANSLLGLGTTPKEVASV
jgi:hypothetical protein